VQYRKSLGHAIYDQLATDTSLTDALGIYTVDSTEYAAIYAGQVPEDKREYPYIVIYAPLTPGPSVHAFNARRFNDSGTSDVARKPSFQLNLYTKDRLKVANIQNIMDLVDNALSTSFEQEGLNLRPKNPTNGVPEWREDEGHWWVWMRFQCIVLESET